MELYLNGVLTVDKPIAENMQKYILNELAEEESLYYADAFSFSKDGKQLECNDVVGDDCIDELNCIAHYLEDNGFQVLCDETRFSYYGDYEGGYLYEKGAFRSYDISDFLLHTTPVEVLIDIIRARGYEIAVSKGEILRPHSTA